MGKRGNSNAQRARRKMIKSQKRKKVIAKKKDGILPSKVLTADLDTLPDWTPLLRKWQSSLEWDPRIEGLEGFAALREIHPHEAAVIADCPGCYPAVKRPPELWTRPKVAALTTDDILARLQALGARTDEAAFDEAARRHISAWQLSRDEWLAGSIASRSIHDRDFLGLAAHELWKRWRPGDPSIEMLLEPMFEKRHATDAWDDAELGLAFWAGLKRVLTSTTQKTDLIDDMLADEGEPFFDWSLDFAEESAAAADELGPVIALRIAKALSEMLDQFTGEGDEWKYLIKTSRARVLVGAGMFEEGERALRELIEQHPEMSKAYAVLADVWASSAVDDPAAIERALALLIQALAAIDKEDERQDVQIDLEELRGMLADVERRDTERPRRAAPD